MPNRKKAKLKRDEQVFEEGHGHRGRKALRRIGCVGQELDHPNNGDQGDGELKHQLAFARQALVGFLRDFAPVVDEADRPKAGGDEQHDPQILIAQITPQDHRRHHSGEDDETAHGGGAGLATIWLSGPSSRIGWLPLVFSHLMKGSPMISAMMKAVINAPPVRKVR
jgi:hypothetical protein